MSALENYVQTLADALDKLEARVEDSIATAGAQSEAVDAARRQARTAKAQINAASDGLSASIKELRAMLKPADDNA